MLPQQLAPYYQYTIRAIVGMTLLAHDFVDMRGRGIEAATLELHPDSAVLPGRVWEWMYAVRRALSRAYALLGAGEVSATDPGCSACVVLRQVRALFDALMVRGPPEVCAAREIDALARRYVTRAGHYFLGTSSQERRRGVRGGTVA